MGAQSDRLRCEVCQNLFLSPMNTGLLRYAVATALTVYGIETLRELGQITKIGLQQHLPFTVLKLVSFPKQRRVILGKVATALTVYGIETRAIRCEQSKFSSCNSTYRLRY